MQIKFDDINVPTEKLEQVVNQSMYDIKSQYKKKKQWNYLVRGTVAAAAVLALTGIFASNPALAAKLPLVGHIFERVQDEQVYPGNFNEVAEPVKDHNVSEDQGIKITLSEIYSDSRAMYVSAMVESEDAFPEELKESNVSEGDDTGVHMYLNMEQELDFMTPPESYGPMEWPGKEFEWTPLDLKGEFVDEHTYIGALRISFNEYPVAGFEVPDTFHWKLNVKNLYMLDENGTSFSKEGTWGFETDVSIDHSKVKVVDVNESAQTGDVIKSVTMTPYEVFVDFRFDESKVEAGYEKYDSLQCVMVDADGARIEDRVGSFSPAGYNLSRMTFYYLQTLTEEEHDAHMGRVRELSEGALKEQLVSYLEENSVRKIEVELGDYYKH